jgi:hypothetical protein
MRQLRTYPPVVPIEPTVDDSMMRADGNRAQKREIWTPFDDDGE